MRTNSTTHDSDMPESWRENQTPLSPLPLSPPPPSRTKGDGEESKERGIGSPRHCHRAYRLRRSFGSGIPSRFLLARKGPLRRADRLERIREFPSPLAVLFYLSLLPFFFRNYVGMLGRELEIGDKQYEVLRGKYWGKFSNSFLN